MRLLRVFSKIVLGLVFTFSGFVKCVDPLGTAYKINDYLISFELPNLTQYALVLSFIMCGLELLIGLMLLTNTKINWAALMALVFMLVYTPLTLYLAIFNPVTDCGCFGDALIITNWQTFFKNVILLILALVLFVFRKDFNELFRPGLRIVFLFLLAGLIFGFEMFSINHLPILDFRPYKVGNNIQEGMIIPEGAAEEVIESVFIYEKDGQTREFLLNEIPEGWNFVDRKDKVLVKGYEPPIHNFNITDLYGEDITDEVLSSNYVALLIAYDLDKTDPTHMEEINYLAEDFDSRGHRFICLTSSGPEKIAEFQQEYQTKFSFCTMDQVTLKTIIRSNPGLMLIKNGTILNKWHHKHLPSIGELSYDIQTVEY